MTPKERAAMQQALDYLKNSHARFYEEREKTITALREALAEPDIEEMTLTQIAARHEQAEQEPVCIDWDTKTDEPIMGYAAPVRTKDLTDKQIEKVWNKNGGYMGMPIDFARAVIAADRENNK